MLGVKYMAFIAALFLASTTAFSFWWARNSHGCRGCNVAKLATILDDVENARARGDDLESMELPGDVEKWVTIFRGMHYSVRMDIVDELLQNPVLYSNCGTLPFFKKLLSREFSYETYPEDDIADLATELKDMTRWILDNMENFIGALKKDAAKTTDGAFNVLAYVSIIAPLFEKQLGPKAKSK